MHELSLVLSIVDQIEAEVFKLKAKEVKRIELEIGALAGVEWDSFDFAWQPSVKNTVLQNAERIVHHIPAIAVCSDCSREFEKKEPYDACPACGNYLHHLLSGKELKVKSIVIE